MMKSTNQKLLVSGILILMVLSTTCMAEEDYHNILSIADTARGNYDGIAWKVNVKTGKKHKQFFVRALGFDLLAETISPAKYKGNKILMVSGNMWFYKPRLSKPVPISRRQKLLGEAAYGDISSTNYADAYTIESVQNDTLNGEQCFLFDLVSKTKENTYDRIHYWVAKDRMVGIKADYFTVSGKLIKSAQMQYQNTVSIADKDQLFISQITISDQIQIGDVTELEFNNPELKKIPDYLFNVNFLRR